MKAKKLLASLISAVMVLSTIVCPVFAGSDVANIGETGYATLADAVAAANSNTTITVSDGTHTMPSSISDKDIVIKGSDKAVIEMFGSVAANGSSVEFDGVTVKFDNDIYEGLQTPDKLVYKNCTHIGTEFLYAPTVVFENCKFEMYDASTEYSVWTYGSKNITFTDCVFNTHGKAILVYNEWATNDYVANINLTNCIFNSDKTVATDKAAVEMGKSGCGGVNTYNLTFENCTAEDFSTNNSTSPLWGDKNCMISGTGSEEYAATGNVGIAIDGEVIVEEEGSSVSVAMVDDKKYSSLQTAIDAAAISGAPVIMQANTTINAVDGEPETHAWVKEGQNVVIDMNGNTVTGAFFINGTATIKGGTIINNSIVSGIETQGNLTLEDMTITSNRHAVRVSGGNVTINSGTYRTTAQTSTSGYALNVKSSSGAVATVNGGEFYGCSTSSVTGKTAVTVQTDADKIIINGGKFCSGTTEGTSYSVENYSSTSQINGGEFVGALVNGFKNITGGMFHADPTSQVADGYRAFQKYNTKNVFFVAEKKEAPKAVIEIIDNPEVTLGTEEKINLESTYCFKAPDVTDEAALDSQYSTWHADFVVSADKDIPANSIVLAGNYGEYGWIAFKNDTEVKAGTEIRLLKLAGLSMNYYELCTLVKEFKCGVADVDDVLDGVKFTVELRMYEVEPYTSTNTTWNTEKADTEPIVSNKVDYVIGSDANVSWVTATDAGYYSDETGIMRFLFSAMPGKGNITGFGVEYEGATTNPDEVSINITGGSSIVFAADLAGFTKAQIAEKGNKITARGYITVGGKKMYSDDTVCTADWTKLLDGGNK